MVVEGYTDTVPAFIHEVTLYLIVRRRLVAPLRNTEE